MNNLKRKITVTTGTRSEYGILRPLLNEIKKSKKSDLHLIVAGMHLSKKHGTTINEIIKDGFKISAKIKMIPLGNTNYHMSLALGNGIIQFSKFFKLIKPDINVILGDRDEAFASAIAAFHMNIPNAHIHGGDKSQAGIDEYIRHAITKISNIHFVGTKKSRDRVIKMGENPKYVHLTGSPSVDELRNNITSKKQLEKKYGVTFIGDEILLLQHPLTTQSKNSKNEIQETLRSIKLLHKSTIAILPNSDAGHQEIYNDLLKFSKENSFLKLFPSVPRADYLGFLKNCAVLVGNSSSGVIEGSYFNTPVIDIGIRQNNRERGDNVIVVPSSYSKIHRAISRGLWLKKNKKFKNKFIYGRGGASKKILKQLELVKLDKKLIQKQIYY